MLNKKGVGDNILSWNFVYIIFVIVFFMLALYWIVGFQDGAALWEDFYAKEISHIVNTASPGEEVFLDVTDATALALGNKVIKSDIFNFNNVNSVITVKLIANGGTSFSFFNNVDVVERDIRSVSGGAETNRLYFKVVEKQKEALDEDVE